MVLFFNYNNSKIIIFIKNFIILNTIKLLWAFTLTSIAIIFYVTSLKNKNHLFMTSNILIFELQIF